MRIKGSVLIIYILIAFSCGSNESNKQIFFVGGYTSSSFEGLGEGIYVCELDTEKGSMIMLDTFQVADPSYLAVHPNGKYLYAATEAGGENPGIITALNIGDNGSLEMINRVDAGGAYPCYISLSNDNKYLLVANYGDGSVTTIPVKKDGSLSAVAGRAKHSGSGPFQLRQTTPHAHFFNVGVNDSTALAVDLGIDRVIHYRLKDDGQLDSLAATQTMAGTGPRHLAVPPNNKYCYVLSEFSNNIEVFEIKSELEPFKLIQVVKTTADNLPFYTSISSTIKIHPSGKFLYAANRGKPTGDENSIAAFKINPKNGKLEFIETVDSGGDVPRDFEIDPTGKYLIVANQFSNNLISFSINPENGKLESTGFALSVKSGTCVKFLN